MALSASDRKKLERALSGASASDRRAALLSWDSLQKFMKRVGLHWLIDKIAGAIDQVLKWLAEIF